MQLSVPRRALADSNSFPVEPDDVHSWLDGLRPLDSERDARAVYRGLKHSNRLQNDPERRRAVLERFTPMLGALHEQLSELTRAQPLPLTRDFARTGTLLEGLLREEAFACKILLGDYDKPDPDDARRAMRALARLADVITQSYQVLPRTLIADAETLYLFSESNGLLEPGCASDDASIADHFHYLLLLSLSDPRQIRARQLPLALDFLREAASDIALHTIATSTDRDTLGVVLGEGATATGTASLIVDDPGRLRVFGVTGLLERISRQIARTPVVRSNTFGIESLERQTLGRLHAALARDRPRRSARTILCQERPLLFGHKEIATRMWFESTTDPVTEANVCLDGDEDDVWTLVNRCANGACVTSKGQRPGTVQVGELVALEAGPSEAMTSTADRSTTMLGTVRWLRADEQDAITLGIEFLSRGVISVSVARRDADASVTEPAMIIACKVKQAVVQTILLPPYLYDTGETLIATQIVPTLRGESGRAVPSERSRELTLKGCLQINGLYGHFLVG